MTYLAILLVMLVAFTVVGWPLISSSPARRESGERSPFDDLIGERDAAYQSIKELDFEYQLGNLSESDYQRLRQWYRREAASTLRKLDAALKGASEATGRGPAASSETASSDSPSAQIACPYCGKRAQTGDRYCWSCGARLEAEA